jgi:transposase
MEKKCRDYEPNQALLLPPSISEFVPAGHLSHFVRRVVMNELDLSAIEGEYTESRGAPPFSPRMMTAILLYGFTQGVYSARKLARACEERLDFMAVSALNKPQFRAIAGFRHRHLEALGELFLQVLKLCQKSKMITLGHVSLDGTKLKGNASKGKNKRYKDICREEAQLKAQVDKWLKAGVAADAAEDEEFGEDQRGDELPAWVTDAQERGARFGKAREELEQEKAEQQKARQEAQKKGKKPRSHERTSAEVSPKKTYNFTDPDSALLRTRDGFVQGYNAQIAVENGSYVIVGCDVSRAANDRDELRPMLEQIRETFGRNATELSADTGYASEENLKLLEKEGIRGYIALQSTRSRAKSTVTNWTAPSTKRMQKRLAQGGKRSRYRLRSQTVEPVFGILKAARGFTQFLLRGLKNVQNEFKILCSAHNLIKLHQARAAL